MRNLHVWLYENETKYLAASTGDTFRNLRMSFDITFKVACVLVNLLYESLLATSPLTLQTLSNNLDVFSYSSSAVYYRLSQDVIHIYSFINFFWRHKASQKSQLTVLIFVHNSLGGVRFHHEYLWLSGIIQTNGSCIGQSFIQVLNHPYFFALSTTKSHRMQFN